MVQAIDILYFEPADFYDSHREFFVIAPGDSLNRFLHGKNYAELKRSYVQLREGEHLFEVRQIGAGDLSDFVREINPPVLPRMIPFGGDLLLIGIPIEAVINYFERIYGFPKDWSQVKMPEQARTLLHLCHEPDSAQYSGTPGSGPD